MLRQLAVDDIAKAFDMPVDWLMPDAKGTISGVLDVVTVDRVRAVIDTIDYKVGARIRSWYDFAGRVVVECVLPAQALPSEGSDAPITLTARRVISGTPTDDEIAQILLATFIETEAHECCEWFRVNGRMVCNPHAEPALKYAVANPLPRFL